MYKLCKTEQSARRQRQLEAGLLGAMENCRYEEISVSDLCDRLHIPRKSFYRYFTGKDGALQALLDHTLMEFDPFTLGYRKGRTRTVELDLESFFQFWLDHRKLLDALRRNALAGMLVERSVAFALTDKALPSRFLPEDSPMMQEHVTSFAVCGLMSMVMSWHQRGFDRTPRELSGIAVRMLGQPLFPEPEKRISQV